MLSDVIRFLCLGKDTHLNNISFFVGGGGASIWDGFRDRHSQGPR